MYLIEELLCITSLLILKKVYTLLKKKKKKKMILKKWTMRLWSWIKAFEEMDNEIMVIMLCLLVELGMRLSLCAFQWICYTSAHFDFLIKFLLRFGTFHLIVPFFLFSCTEMWVICVFQHWDYSDEELYICIENEANSSQFDDLLSYKL